MTAPRPAVIAALVALTAAAVFAPAITGPWIYDDHPLIADNPYVHSFASWPRWFVTDFWNTGDDVLHFGRRMIYWRPAISASYALDWQVSSTCGSDQPPILLPPLRTREQRRSTSSSSTRISPVTQRIFNGLCACLASAPSLLWIM